MKKSELMSLFVLMLMAIMIILFYFIEPIELFKNFFLSLPVLVYIVISFMAYDNLVEKLGVVRKYNIIGVFYYTLVFIWFFLLIFFINGYLDYFCFEVLQYIIIVVDAYVFLYLFFSFLKKMRENK